MNGAGWGIACDAGQCSLEEEEEEEEDGSGILVGASESDARTSRVTYAHNDPSSHQAIDPIQ